MPASHLWAVNSFGKVYTLSVKEQCWREVPYQGLEFKRVSALRNSIWAVGGDHQIYVFIPSDDVPIRVREVTYENERWNPVEGFSSKLLPSDRPHWSSEDGLIHTPKESFYLPTSSWEWEDDWYIEQTLDGQPLGAEGWTYSVDFPFTYSPEKNWKSMVRRRKWVRHRRYAATNKWTQILSIHGDPVAEPFIDIAVGGYDIPGGDPDVLTVWGVTVLGRVVYRHGVCRLCPEGKGWSHIPTNHSKGTAEIHQISVGPTGLVWAVTWDGDILVRLGVTRDNIMGIIWEPVGPPDEKHRILQVSVGADVVWAISRDKKVWFRTGIKGVQAGNSVSAATGNAWVEMVGEMSLITVGPGNQVWALDQDGTSIFYRTDVSYAELSGRTWRPIILPISRYPRRTGSSSSLSSTGALSQVHDSETDSFKDYVVRSSPKMTHVKTIAEQSREEAISSIFPTWKSIDLSSMPSRKPSTAKEMEEMLRSFSASSSRSFPGTDTDFDSIYDQPDFFPETGSTGINAPSGGRVDIELDHKDSLRTARVTFSSCGLAKLEDTLSTVDLNADKDVMERGEGSCVDDSGVDDAWSGDVSNNAADFRDDHYGDDMASWTWISGSGCTVNAQAIPHWFKNAIFNNDLMINESWRMAILSRLRSRYEECVEKFSSFPEAVEKGVWIKTGTCKILESSRCQLWITCHLSLERSGVEEAADSSTLSIRYLAGQDKKLCFNLADVTCIVNASDRTQHIMAVHTASLTLARKPLKLNFSTDAEMEDWLATLNNTCCTLRKIRGTPDPTAIWSTTVQGDIYVCQPSSNLENSLLSSLFWRLIGGGHLLQVETCPIGIVWGLGYNNTPWIYTGGHGGGPFKGISGCNVHINHITDVRCIYIYENQRWNPLSSFSSKGLPTDRYMWSDKTGRYYCTKENTKLPSCHWQWVSDWAIDYKTPGGVDKEGWQYASDFPRAYYPYKSITHYVRRRRWYRKCQLSTTGPWKELPSTPLIDVSIQIDLPELPKESIALWAVTVNGEPLCRLGVTRTCPEGSSWISVPAEQPLISISVGGGYRVWAVGKNGSAFLRNGVSPICPTGQVWFHIEPPKKGSVLKQISAGKTSVFAVDTENNLWFRQDIMPLFPEGTCWSHVSENIRQVSVGPEDQVWAICDSLQTSSGTVYGIMCRRVGITAENKAGTDWEYGIGGGWQHISIRGCSEDAERDYC